MCPHVPSGCQSTSFPSRAGRSASTLRTCTTSTRLADCRALLVWPTKDVAFRTPERRRWEAVFPDHRTVLLEGAGHYIQEDAPDEIITAIRDWV
jgi:pimeloyl-ACP methyl ester carboxylesterase